MSVSTCGQFVSLLTQSNLLAAEQLLAARRELATAGDEQLPGIVERIVERGWLTGWQARMLLAGHHAFFLGRYKLLDHLGEGGMGSVFKAEQTPLGRTVAIKLISKRRVKDAEAAARFHREIQAAAALSHPHIVAAYDADAVAGRHFLVMEYVAGRDLRAIVKGGKTLPIGEACEYVRQAALGLEHAHQRGMIHRDLKPSNLLLTRGNDGHPLVKILDMGLARLDVADGFEQTELTHTGQIVGTPDYISPEQARDSKSADARSDVYSLGCTLFRLVSGRVPFEGDGAMAKLMARMSDDPPALRSILPEAPAELEAVLLKMMAREPADRYQSSGEVVAALAPFAELPATPACIAETTPSARQVAAAVTYERPPTIDPGLNDFLQNLETAAAREEEAVSTDDLKQTLASGAGAPTAGWSAPVASEQPQASDPGRQQPAHAGRSLQMTRAGKKLQEEIAARNRRERRRLLLIATAIVLLIAAVVGFQQWYQAGEVTLTVDWPRDDLQSATLTEAGRQRRFPNKGQLEYRGRPGTYRLKLQRAGHEPIDETIQLQRAAVKEYHPQWIPNAATKRKTALVDFQQRTAEIFTNLAPGDSPGAGAPDLDKLVDDPQVVQLRSELIAFRREHSGTGEAVAAAKLMSRLPWPVDNHLPLTDIHTDPPIKPDIPIIAVLGATDVRLRHWNSITSLEFAPDGTHLISAGGDGVAKLWNVQTGQLVRTFSGHRSAMVGCAAFSPDGKRLATSGGDGFVRLWDTTSGRELFSFSASSQGAAGRSVVFSQDGSTVVSCGHDGTLRLWDVEQGKEKWARRGHTAAVDALAVSYDSKMFASAGHGNSIKVWDAQSMRQEPIRVISKSERTSQILFSEDGDALITDSPPTVWDVETGMRRFDFSPPDSRSVRCMALAPGGVLAMGGGTGHVTLFDLHQRKELHTFRPHSSALNALAFDADGSLLATGDGKGIIRIWEMTSGEPSSRFPDRNDPLTPIACSPDGSRIAFATNDSIALWNTFDGEQEHLPLHEDAPVLSLAFSSDGQTLAAAVGGTVRLWRVANRQELGGSRFGRSVQAVVFGPHGNTIADGSTDGSVTVRSFDDLDVRWVRVAHWAMNSPQRGTTSLAFSSDGRFLASGGRDMTAKVWDVKTGKALREYRQQHVGNVAALTFGTGNKLLAAAVEHKGVVLIYDITEPAVERPVQLAQHWPLSVAWSPQRGMLASAGMDRMVHLWDMSQSEPSLLRSFPIAPPHGRVSALAFTPDGRHLVTANGNGTVYVLRLQEWSPR